MNNVTFGTCFQIQVTTYDYTGKKYVNIYLPDTRFIYAR